MAPEELLKVGVPRERRAVGRPFMWEGVTAEELLMAASVAASFVDSHRVSALSDMPGARSPI